MELQRLPDHDAEQQKVGLLAIEAGSSPGADAALPRSTDELLQASGGFGRAQAGIVAVAFVAWVVHGAQVMSMGFVGPAAAEEFYEEATAVKLAGSAFFAGASPSRCRTTTTTS